MGFLSGIFGKKAPAPTLRWEDVAEKPFLELLPFVKREFSKSPTCEVSSLITFQRRLFEIAFWDNHVPEDHRIKAVDIAKSLTNDIENALAGSPEGLEPYRAAVKHMVQASPFGSLHWLIDENNIPSDQIPAFAIRVENAPLLRPFLEAASSSGPMVIKEFTRDMLRELIHARRPDGGKNAVLILHGLAVARDPTLEAILTPEQIWAFRNAHRDYQKARCALADLLIEPDDPGCLSFEPIPSPDSLADLVIMDMRANHEGTDEDDGWKAYLDGLSEEGRSNARFAKSIMTLHLAIQQAGSIYGEEFGVSLRTKFLEKLSRMRDGGLEFLLKKVEITEDETYDRIGFSPDFLFLDEVLHMGKEEERTEESFEAEKESTTKGSNLLSAYRTQFLEYFRYRLRFFAAMERGEPTERHPGDYADDWIYKPQITG